MPKENTHLYFASKCQKNLDYLAKKIIGKNLDYYYFGSISPDIFFYSKIKKLHKISDNLHGKNGNLTNEVILDLLVQAKDKQSEIDLTVIFGYLTHCALDIVFHPVIYYLTGNYYHADNIKRQEAIYRHRQLETYIDYKLNSTFYYPALIKINLALETNFFLLLSKKFNVKFADLKAAFKRQYFWNKLFRNNFAFNFIYYLSKISVIDEPETLGLFYGNLSKDKLEVEEPIFYQDLVTGEKNNNSIDDLLIKAKELAKDFIETAKAYYDDRISYEDCINKIPGYSLDTGKIGVGVENIKYFKE